MSHYRHLGFNYATSSPITISTEGDDSTAPLLLREYLEAVHISVGIAAKEGWRINVSLDATPEALLLIPARERFGLLAVRAVDLAQIHEHIGDHYRELGIPFETSRLVEATDNANLAVADVPTPFRVGILDGPVVWVCRDPFHALRLQSLGMAATALAHPSRTLGSIEGLDQLERLGGLSVRNAPWGTLVILDDDSEPLSFEESRTLDHVYEEVWEAPRLYRMFYTAVETATGKARANGTAVDQEMLAQVRAHGQRVPSFPDPHSLRLWESTGSDDLDDMLRPLPAYWGGRGGSGTREPLELVPMSRLATMAPSVKWLVEDFVAMDTITELQGIPKDGKTTLALPMAAAVSRGGTFLGRQCKQAPVVYVSEQTRTTLLASLIRAGTDVEDPRELPDLHVLSVERLFGRTWDEILSFLRAECRELEAGLVVFDTLGQVSMLQGEAEASTGGGARELFRSLKSFNLDGVAVLAVRHSRKAGGGIIETGLGSVTVSGEADHIVRLRKLDDDPADVRRIDSVGRLSAPLDIAVELTARGWVDYPLALKPLGQGGSGNGTSSPGKSAGNPKVFVLDAVNGAGTAGVVAKDVVRLARDSGQTGLGASTIRSTLKSLSEPKSGNPEIGVDKTVRPFRYFKL